MFLVVEELVRDFGSERVLDHVSFSVEEGEIVSIIGPSGVGKTTLLKLLAGLDAPDQGQVRFETVPSRLHPAIIVFQDYVLFPNMTVFENVAFGLRARKLSGGKVETRVMDMLGWFGLAEKRGQYPAQLSAGQSQRVAIARAMVVEPMLLLLDEPFANLDRGLKMQTAEFIRDTQKAFGVTTVAVTHDLEEAFVMSDRIGVMLGGHLVQFDAPREVYMHPRTAEAAAFLGPMNKISGQALTLVELGAGQSGAKAVLARPECITLHADASGPGEVRSVVFAGHYSKYVVSVGECTLTAYGRFNGVTAGDRVRIAVRDCLAT